MSGSDSEQDSDSDQFDPYSDPVTRQAINYQYSLKGIQNIQLSDEEPEPVMHFEKAADWVGANLRHRRQKVEQVADRLHGLRLTDDLGRHIQSPQEDPEDYVDSDDESSDDSSDSDQRHTFMPRMTLSRMRPVISSSSSDSSSEGEPTRGRSRTRVRSRTVSQSSAHRRPQSGSSSELENVSPFSSPQRSSRVLSPLPSPFRSPERRSGNIGALSPLPSPIRSPEGSPGNTRVLSPLRSPFRSPERRSGNIGVLSPLPSPIRSPVRSPGIQIQDVSSPQRTRGLIRRRESSSDDEEGNRRRNPYHVSHPISPVRSPVRPPSPAHSRGLIRELSSDEEEEEEEDNQRRRNIRRKYDIDEPD